MHVLCDLAKLLRRLNRQFSCRAEDHTLQLFQIGIDLLQCRNAKSRRLSSSGLRLSDHVLPAQQARNRLLLYRGEGFKPHLLYRS